MEQGKPLAAAHMEVRLCPGGMAKVGAATAGPRDRGTHSPLAPTRLQMAVSVKMMEDALALQPPVEVYSETKTKRVEVVRRPIGVVAGRSVGWHILKGTGNLVNLAHQHGRFVARHHTVELSRGDGRTEMGPCACSWEYICPQTITLYPAFGRPYRRATQRCFPTWSI